LIHSSSPVKYFDSTYNLSTVRYSFSYIYKPTQLVYLVINKEMLQLKINKWTNILKYWNIEDLYGSKM
jgi:hypothetical protein